MTVFPQLFKKMHSFGLGHCEAIAFAACRLFQRLKARRGFLKTAYLTSNSTRSCLLFFKCLTNFS
ncbi:hypothetical protein XarbCFBP8142_15045 [Xanthomonas arboricola]|nr:hypothetical protein XarbCFBP8142_15045 [Xanthomonas arboricola]